MMSPLHPLSKRESNPSLDCLPGAEEGCGQCAESRLGCQGHQAGGADSSGILRAGGMSGSDWVCARQYPGVSLVKGHTHELVLNQSLHVKAVKGYIQTIPDTIWTSLGRSQHSTPSFTPTTTALSHATI